MKFRDVNNLRPEARHMLVDSDGMCLESTFFSGVGLVVGVGIEGEMRAAGFIAGPFTRADAIEHAIWILESAGCSVRRVAFGHMLPDQVTVGVPPEIVDGEVEDLPEAGT